MTIEFTVFGKPVGKARPRATTIGGHAHIYTPQATKQYETEVKKQYIATVGTLKLKPPINLRVLAIYAVPVSYPSKKRNACLSGKIAPRKPDWDNVGKIISDALNGLAYDDDADICDAHVIKRYGERECVRVQLTGDI